MSCISCGKDIPPGVILCADCILRLTGVYPKEPVALNTEDAEDEKLNEDGAR